MLPGRRYTQFPIVTPNTLVHGEDMYDLGDDIDSVNGDLRKQAKYIRRCKENAWKRWKNEYLKSLREKHNMQSKKQKLPPLSTEDDWRTRNHSTIGIVDSLIVERDGVTKAAKVQTGKSTWEIAIQQLYSLELRCDSISQDQIKVIDEIKSKRKQTLRNVAAITRSSMQDQ